MIITITFSVCESWKKLIIWKVQEVTRWQEVFCSFSDNKLKFLPFGTEGSSILSRGKRNLWIRQSKAKMATISGWSLCQGERWARGCLRHGRLRGGVEEDSRVHETRRRSVQGFLQVRLRRFPRSAALSAERELQHTPSADRRAYTQWAFCTVFNNFSYDFPSLSSFKKCQLLIS